jgi:uncharacterized protein
MDMLRTILITVAFALGSVAAKADPPDRTKEMELAVELLALMDMDKMFAGIQENMEQMMQAQIAAVSDCDALRPAIERFSKEMGGEVMGMLKADAFLADIAQIYVDVFPIDELQGMLDFYRSPLGQKMLEKMPELMQRSMEISQNQMAEMIPKVEAASQRFADEVREAKTVCDAMID